MNSNPPDNTLYRAVVDAMTDGVAFWDAQGRLRLWNEAFRCLLPPELRARLRAGMARHDLADLNRSCGRHNTAEPDCPRCAGEPDRRGRVTGHHDDLVLADGRIYDVAEHPTADGGTISVHRDVTDEREARARLALSEQRLYDFVDSISDWVWETDSEDRYTYLTFGSRPMPLDLLAAIGKTRREWLIARGVPIPEAYAELDRIIARREPFSSFVYETHRWADGGAMVVELSGKPLFDAEGGFLGYRGIGRDVTELQRQERELQRALAAERAMSAQQRRFIAMASHEFRTPLAAIDGAAQRIAALGERGTGLADEAVAKRLKRIRAAVGQMVSIIDRTLSSARLEDGRVVVAPQPVDVTELLAGLCDRQRQISPEFDIELTAPDARQMIVGDPKLLDHVFSNLLGNAVKYSGTSRRVVLQVTPADDAVEVAIRDRGLGIDAEDLPRLFTRFFRAKTAQGLSGSGIGLHLARELLTLQGGTVSVTSAPGRGSTFVVRLPVVP